MALGLAKHSIELKRFAAFKHVVNGAAKLDAQVRERAGFAVFLLDSLGKGFDFRAAAFEKGNRLTKRPLEVSVTDLLAGAAVRLAVGSVTSFDQSAVRQELSDGWESLDVVDFVKHRHREDPSDARNRLQAEEILWIVQLGTFLEVQFEFSNLFVVVAKEIQVQFNRSSHAWLLESGGDANTIGFVG